jgi:hypothetical protein
MQALTLEIAMSFPWTVPAHCQLRNAMIPSFLLTDWKCELNSKQKKVGRSYGQDMAAAVREPCLAQLNEPEPFNRTKQQSRDCSLMV